MNTPDTEEKVCCEHSLLNLGNDAHIENILTGGKSARALGVVIIILFVGILLSFLVDFGVSAYLGTEELADSYLDGNSHDGIVFKVFADSFYLSESIRQNVIRADYYLFGKLHTDDVLLGSDKFLFPAYDKDADYNYIADYLGESIPTEADCERYRLAIEKLTEAYARLGSDCYFVIIPSSQTVYSEKMPDFMGAISEDTRLSVIADYLAVHGTDNFIDLTAPLIAAKTEGELYNNTEDSLNSRGAYYAYLALMDKLPQEATKNTPGVSLKEGDLVRLTTVGKELARAAKLEKVIKNRTVSISTDFIQKYQILIHYDEYDMAFPKNNYKNEFAGTPRIQFCFSEDWDRIIMIDYLANTFGTTIYRSNLAFNSAVIEKADPEYTVYFLHEKDLHRLIDGSMLPN